MLPYVGAETLHPWPLLEEQLGLQTLCSRKAAMELHNLLTLYDTWACAAADGFLADVSSVTTQWPKSARFALLARINTTVMRSAVHYVCIDKGFCVDAAS